mmetsp:Transcript_19449/g.61174  ORF Transcript_19449/g.61174 Transcript_19449/m.61174 type:complete len:499 (+) Transcript_19449:93-1589(+)
MAVLRICEHLVLTTLLVAMTAAVELHAEVEFGSGNDLQELRWARFDGGDCVKQTSAHEAQCIPCKKNLTDGTQVDRFAGNCKRDATVLASQIFTPWHFCGEDGGCSQGRLPKFQGRVCWAFNKGKFTRFSGPAGVCIKEWWHSRHIPTVSYALANMAHGWKNVADFVAAYQWSMEQREKWGDQPKTVMTCQLFCNGQKACGSVGDCTCGSGCNSSEPATAPTPTPMPTATPAPTSAPPSSEPAPAPTPTPTPTATPAPTSAPPSSEPTPAPTPTPTPTATSAPTSAPPPPARWSSAADGAEQACRGANASDNSAAYYLISRQASSEGCKAQCLQEPRCRGIEYSSTGRCEVWIRPGGIKATKQLPGFTCLRYEPSAFNPIGGGQNRACRGARSTDNSPTYYALTRNADSLQDCEALCEREPRCKGIEYSRNRCEVWTRPGGIQATAPVAGYSCFGYEPIAALAQAKKAARPHTFLARVLIQMGVVSSRLEPTEASCEA